MDDTIGDTPNGPRSFLQLTRVTQRARDSPIYQASQALHKMSSGYLPYLLRPPRLETPPPLPPTGTRLGLPQLGVM
jgi:hypothetical protein